MTPTITLNPDVAAMSASSQKALELEQIFVQCYAEIDGSADAAFEDLFNLDSSSEQFKDALNEFFAYSFATKLLERFIAVAQKGNAQKIEHVVRYMQYRFNNLGSESINPEIAKFIRIILDTTVNHHFCL